MDRRVVTEHPGARCQQKDCQNLVMEIRKYGGGDYGLNCQEHSICGNCLCLTDGWTCIMCEPCDERVEKLRKEDKEATKRLKESFAKLQ